LSYARGGQIYDSSLNALSQVPDYVTKFTMFARIEVSLKPDFQDAIAVPLLRRMEMTDPHLRKLVRWARSVDVYWLDLPLAREELIYATNEVLFDPVLHWLFTGNLIPSAAAKKGGVEDLLETAPNRPGKFFAIEKRFRLGVTDHPARTLVDAFEAVLKRKLEKPRVASGSMLILEGPGLTEEHLARIAREYFSNELLESWTLQTERELSHSERFHPERVKREMPKSLQPRVAGPLETIPLSSLSTGEILNYCKRKGFKLSESQIPQIQKYYRDQEKRDATEAELEIFSKVWGDQSSRKFIRSTFKYETSKEARSEVGNEIPHEIINPLAKTFAETVNEVPRSWILSAFENQAPLVALDEEDALSIENEIESKSVASDALHGAMMGMGESILRSSLASRGARPILTTDIIFTPDLYSLPQGSLESMHPRRVLDGVKQGISMAGTQLGVPTVGGALYVDSKEGATPVLHLSNISILPKTSSGQSAELKEANAGDLLVLVGSKTGRDGVLGSPSVQIVDTLTQKKIMGLVLEAREQGLTKALYEVGESGLAWSLFNIATQFGGVKLDLNQVPLRQPGLRAAEILGSESLERVIMVIAPENQEAVLSLISKRAMDGRIVGSISSLPRLEIQFENESVVSIDLKMLKEGDHSAVRSASWTGPKKPKLREYADFAKEGVEVLLRLLSHPNISSREWFIKQMDYEVQGTSALKPLHTIAYSSDVTQSGPNDASIIKPKSQLNLGLIISSGLQPRMAALDPYVMGQLAVDEAVRNALAVGADYGKEELLFALNYQLSWPEKDQNDLDASSALAGTMIRAAYGAKNASVELQTPFVSGIEKGITGTSSRLHFVVQSLARVGKLGGIRSSDFKTPGDAIYLVGPAQFGLLGSQIADLNGAPDDAMMPMPDWDTARRLYSWMGGAIGKEQKKLRSIHDVSDGGLLVAVAECLIARGLGATIQYPEGLSRTMEWEFLLGEGFHSFIITVPEIDIPLIEAEMSQSNIPFCRLGSVTGAGVLQVKRGETPILAIETKVLRQAWKKEGYWE
jgi:phosphoribosylformylglycinamidine (FGAM) synthase-like enzyme